MLDFPSTNFAGKRSLRATLRNSVENHWAAREGRHSGKSPGFSRNGKSKIFRMHKITRQIRWNGKSQVMHLRLLLGKCTCNSHFGSTAPFLPCFFQWLDGHSQGPGHEDMFLPDFLRDFGLRMAWPRWSQLLARENRRAPSFAARLESNHTCCQRCSGSRDWQGTWWNGWIDCWCFDMSRLTGSYCDDLGWFNWFQMVLYCFSCCWMVRAFVI